MRTSIASGNGILSQPMRRSIASAVASYRRGIPGPPLADWRRTDVTTGLRASQSLRAVTIAGVDLRGDGSQLERPVLRHRVRGANRLRIRDWFEDMTHEPDF